MGRLNLCYKEGGFIKVRTKVLMIMTHLQIFLAY